MVVINAIVQLQVCILVVTLLWLLTSYVYNKVAQGLLFLAKAIQDFRLALKPSQENVTLSTSKITE